MYSQLTVHIVSSEHPPCFLFSSDDSLVRVTMFQESIQLGKFTSQGERTEQKIIPRNLYTIFTHSASENRAVRYFSRCTYMLHICEIIVYIRKVEGLNQEGNCNTNYVSNPLYHPLHSAIFLLLDNVKIYANLTANK